MTAGEPTDNWPWPADRTESSSPSKHNAEDRLIAIAAARCFGTPDGVKILNHLRQITIERPCGPHMPEAVLRDLEGQRRLVHQLYALIQRGRNGE